MKKIMSLSAALLVCQLLFGQGTWVVQVGAFEKPMPLSYFTGLSKVYEVKDHNDIYHYYIGGLKTEQDAKTAAEGAKKAGFNAYVINMDAIEQQCSATCNDAEAGWIYFDYDRDELRADSRRKLQQLAEILKNNPSYRATLSGHTDSHGSDDYNRDLANRRVEAAKKYLLGLGVAASRLTTDAAGEAKPIAKNEVNGTDTPAGRQWNRRVEAAIFDEKGNEKTGMMRTAEVPASLRM